EKFVQPFDNVDKATKLTKESVAAGFVASIPLMKGEQITVNKLSNVGARTGLSRQITPGKRAFAVPVNQQTCVSKMIKPGDRVDVMAFVRIPTKSVEDYKEVQTILQDVLVLSLGTDVANDIPKEFEKD